MKSALKRTKWKKILALNSNNYYKRLAETSSTALGTNYSDAILPGALNFAIEPQVLSQLEFYVFQLTLARHRNLAYYVHAIAKIKVFCIRSYC